MSSVVLLSIHHDPSPYSSKHTLHGNIWLKHCRLPDQRFRLIEANVLLHLLHFDVFMDNIVFLSLSPSFLFSWIWAVTSGDAKVLVLEMFFMGTKDSIWWVCINVCLMVWRNKAAAIGFSSTNGRAGNDQYLVHRMQNFEMLKIGRGSINFHAESNPTVCEVSKVLKLWEKSNIHELPEEIFLPPWWSFFSKRGIPIICIQVNLQKEKKKEKKKKKVLTSFFNP